MRRGLTTFLCVLMLAGSPVAQPFFESRYLKSARVPSQDQAQAEEPSVFQIPVNFSLAGLFERCETILPKEIDESANYIDAGKDTVGRLGVKYKVWRDPLRLSMKGDRLNLDAHVYYWIEVAQIIERPKLVKKLGSCGEGEPPREAEIGLTTTINLGGDWNVVPKTEVRDVKLLNKCSMTFLNLDQTNRIKKRLSEKLAQVAAVIDRRIGRLNLRSRVEAAWSQLQKPIVVDPAGKYLSIAPIDISVSPLNGSGDAVQATLTIRAFITLVWEPIPTGQVPEPKPLPPLAQSRPSPGGLHIIVRTVLPFETASEQLAHAMVGRKYQVAGKQVDITGVMIRGAQERVEIAVNITGFLKGTVYLRGKPAFDPAAQVISMQDLDFAVDSTDPLTKSFAAAAAGSPGFKARLASQARWPVGKQIEEAKAQLGAAINRTEGA
ncbi:MAG TPA: DUF4403 family protein, partial [Blastocatellia bacterium]